ncbi:MAG: hypothetical protein RL745_923 [Actinomycetota bacterium]|jgi:hypothetical protein
MSDLEFEDPAERHSNSSESTEIRESAYLDPELSLMLAILGPAHTPMPDDVWARMQTAIAVESAARETGAAEASDSAPRLADGFRAADDALTGRPGTAQEHPFPAVTASAPTSLSDANDADGEPSVVSRMRGRTRFNFIAAAAVAAAAGGVWLIGGNHIASNRPSTVAEQSSVNMGDSQMRIAGTPVNSAPGTTGTMADSDVSAVAVVAVSGKTYHRESLATEVQPLADGELQPSVDASDVPAVFAKSAECIQAEVSRLAYEDPNTKVTADMGFIDGEPVGVVVETNTADETAAPRIFLADNSGICTLQPIETSGK